MRLRQALYYKERILTSTDGCDDDYDAAATFGDDKDEGEDEPADGIDVLLLLSGVNVTGCTRTTEDDRVRKVTTQQRLR